MEQIMKDAKKIILDAIQESLPDEAVRKGICNKEFHFEGKVIVIAIGKDEIHMLAELAKEELLIREDGEEQTLSFAGVFEQVKKLKEKEKD